MWYGVYEIENHTDLAYRKLCDTLSSENTQIKQNHNWGGVEVCKFVNL